MRKESKKRGMGRRPMFRPSFNPKTRAGKNPAKKNCLKEPI